MIIYTMMVLFLKCLILTCFFSLLECKKCKSRSHSKCINGHIKRKICTEKSIDTSLKDFSIVLNKHDRHGLFSFLSYLPISVLHNLLLKLISFTIELTNYIKQLF